jgi:hypothetical protein
MSAPTRRAFLGLAQHAAAAAAVGTFGFRFIGVAEAMTVAPDLGKIEQTSHFVTKAQWGPPPHRWRPRPRRRRWVCWWHWGRRVCGWRW